MWRLIRKLITVLAIVVSCIFINNGVGRLVMMTADPKDQFSIFRYMHATEIVIIGLFLLLSECNSPLFKANVNIMYKPTPKTILILIFSIFLYTGTNQQLDFYLVIGMGFAMLILSFYAKRSKVTHEEQL